MTSHLTRLALRATRPTGSLRPRSPSMFESATPAPVVGEHPTRVPAGDVQATQLLPDGAAPRQPDLPADEPDRTVPVVTVGAPRPLVDEATRVTPDPVPATPASAPGRAAGPHTASRRSVAKSSTAPPGRSLPAAEAAGVGPQPARRTDLEGASRAGPVATRSPIAEPAPVPPAAFLEPAASDVEAPVHAPPPTNSHAARRGPYEPPVRLPRLQPLMGSDDARGTEVTVNIGRIEVVPPAQSDPPQAREKRQTGPAASGAPKLADYLRDRHRR